MHEGCMEDAWKSIMNIGRIKGDFGNVATG